jgi:hypothetical protein
MTKIIVTRRVALNMGASAASVSALPMSLVIVTARPGTPVGFRPSKIRRLGAKPERPVRRGRVCPKGIHLGSKNEFWSCFDHTLITG